jgi:hypothetical protein
VEARLDLRCADAVTAVAVLIEPIDLTPGEIAVDQPRAGKGRNLRAGHVQILEHDARSEPAARPVVVLRFVQKQEQRVL